MLKFIQARLKSFHYAFSGIAEVVRSQPNAKIHLVGLVASIVLGGVCGLSAIEWAVVALCCGSVLAAEALNTAIENVVDLVSPDYHPLAGKAKDAAAAAVLITAIAAVIVGVIIFLPKIKAIL
ncbi:MAG: hypothetical protein RI894_2255 [Bacteroidota bacterium]|jgi:diacylglycerol kinase